MYLLFAGDSYYPCGGWHDFEGSFISIEDAMERLDSIRCDWWHIVLGGKIVDSGSNR